MFQMPTSSPMMTTMFGFFPDDVDAAPVVVASTPARASNTFLATPSEQAAGRLACVSVVGASSTTCRVGGVAPSARAGGATPLVAARKPSTAPSPTHASD